MKSISYFYSNPQGMDKKDLAALRNKPKEFISPEVETLSSEVTLLKKSAIDFIDVLDKLANIHVLRISKHRVGLAKRLVSRTVRIVLAYRDGYTSRTLSPSQQRRVLDLAEDVLNGRREAIQFQSLSDGNGILELFSREILTVGEDPILKPNTGKHDRF